MKPYASYKPSGVAWLGDVPAHWEVNTIKRGYEITLGKMLQTEQKASTDVSAPYLRSANVQAEKVDVSDVQTMWFTEHEVQQLALEPNDLVVCEGGDAGRSAIWHGEIDGCYFQNSVNRVRGVGHNTTFYLMRWLGVVKSCGYMDIVCNKATIAHLTKEKLANLPMLFPPPDEQQAIADYLDTETARIDTLVQEKEELIGLLREAQASAFAATVLRFATAAAGVKCNRFAWLDSLPTSWRIAKVKHLTLSVDQGISPQCESRPPDDGEWGVLKVGCVNTGDFNAMESKALPSDIMPIEHITLLKGDVLISRANTKNLVGRAAMADKDYPRLMLSDKHYRLRLDESECLPQYLVFVLTHSAVRVHIEERATGASASMLNIDRRTIMDLEIPLPPVELQDEIVREVQADREALARLITHTQEEIALLKELRAATIADAVLGRVDVRSLTQKQ